MPKGRSFWELDGSTFETELWSCLLVQKFASNTVKPSKIHQQITFMAVSSMNDLTRCQTVDFGSRRGSHSRRRGYFCNQPNGTLMTQSKPKLCVAICYEGGKKAFSLQNSGEEYLSVIPLEWKRHRDS